MCAREQMVGHQESESATLAGASESIGHQESESVGREEWGR
jgi:hypothetical protein